MRKVLSALILLALSAGIASAEPIKAGILSKLNMTQEEYSELISNGRKAGTWGFFTSKPDDREIEFKFYDSIQAMQLGLNAGEIEEAVLPEVVAEYVLNVTGQYRVTAIAKTKPAYLAFGFRLDDRGKALAARFNDAILAMKNDGTLAALMGLYVYEAGIGDPEAVEFRKFDNVKDKITIAVTGDLPPIDYVAADGTAAGFNTAVIAEIGKRLNVNIELTYIMSGARAATVMSGRADAVFWIQGFRDVQRHSDIPEMLVLSEPYYEWNEFLFLAR